MIGRRLQFPSRKPGRTTGSGALSPTDTFSPSDWKSWSGTTYDTQHRTITSRTYFVIPSSGTGSVAANFGVTHFGYDALGDN
jgi:hypothetical protein